MVDKTIPDLTAGGAVADADLFEASQAASSVKLTALQVYDYIDAKIASKLIGNSSQTFQDLTASRSEGVTYTNSTGAPILVLLGMFFAGNSSGDTYTLTLDGLAFTSAATSGVARPATEVVIPDGSTYKIQFTGGGGVSFWGELR